MLDINYIIWAIWCYLQIKYFLVAFFTTNDSFLFTAATKNFMFLTHFDQDFYTAFPWIYLPLFRVPSYRKHCLTYQLQPLKVENSNWVVWWNHLQHHCFNVECGVEPHVITEISPFAILPHHGKDPVHKISQLVASWTEKTQPGHIKVLQDLNSKYMCVCSNANPLGYYALRVPCKADKWR